MLLTKSESEKTELNKNIEDKFFSQKLPTRTIGKEKNKDKNKGIKIRLNGIRNLKVSSNVKERAIQ